MLSLDFARLATHRDLRDAVHELAVPVEPRGVKAVYSGFKFRVQVAQGLPKALKTAA